MIAAGSVLQLPPGAVAMAAMAAGCPTVSPLSRPLKARHAGGRHRNMQETLNSLVIRLISRTGHCSGAVSNQWPSVSGSVALWTLSARFPATLRTHSTICSTTTGLVK
jgi:hypothetical protein